MFYAVAFTILWVVLTILWGGSILWCTKLKTTWERYATFRTILGIFFACGAFGTLFYFWVCHPFDVVGTAVSVRPMAVALLAFWALFPPIWFLLEYLAAETGVFSGRSLDIIKAYADLASKIWAAFLALYILILGHGIRHAEQKAKDYTSQRSATSATKAGQVDSQIK
jgi:hypothetical protein